MNKTRAIKYCFHRAQILVTYSHLFKEAFNLFIYNDVLMELINLDKVVARIRIPPKNRFLRLASPFCSCEYLHKKSI